MAFFSLRKCLWITFLLRVFIGSWLLAGGSVGAQIFLLTFLQTLTRYLSIKKENGSQTGSCGLCPLSKVWRECSIEGKCHIPSSCCHFGELQQLEKFPLADPSVSLPPSPISFSALSGLFSESRAAPAQPLAGSGEQAAFAPSVRCVGERDTGSSWRWSRRGCRLSPSPGGREGERAAAWLG